MSQVGAATPSEPIGVLALGWRSLTYALGGLAYKGVALLALPVLARLLSPAELGLLDLAAVVATMIGLSAALGTDQGVAFLEPRTDPRAGIWASTLVIISILAGAFVLVAAIGGRAVADWLTGNPADHRILVAAALYGWILALTTTALNAIRLHGTPRTYALASFVIVTAEMSGALVIAWRFESPIALMVLAWAAGAAIVVLPLLVRYIPAFGVPQIGTMSRLAAFGAPLVPAAIAWLVGDVWIRATLGQLLELEALGVYGIAFRIVSVIALAVTGFGVAWQPYIFRSPRNEVHERASRLLPYLILGLGTAAVAVTALAPEVIVLVAGDPYLRAREVVPTLGAGAVAMGAFVLLSAVVGASGSTRRVAFAAVGGALVQALTAPALIGAIGLAGSGAASLTGYLLAVAVLGVGERRLLSGRRGWMAASAGLVVIGGLVATSATQEWPVLVRAAVVLGFVGIAGALALLIRHEARSGS